MWILIITYLAYGGNYSGTISSITFESKQACLQAEQVYRTSLDLTKWDSIKTVCVAKGN